MTSSYMGMAPSLFPSANPDPIVPQSTDVTVAFQAGDSTTGVTRAGGVSMIYGYGYQKTTALTGTLRGVRGNSVCFVDSTDGTFVGVEGRAGNGTSASAHDGLNAGTLKGGYFFVAGSGVASGNTITTAVGIDAQLDVDSSGLTVTNAYGARINVQGGQGSTLTNLYGLVIEHESVDGTGATMDAAIKVTSVNGNEPITCLIDASGAALAVHDTDQYPLIKISTLILSWDVSASTWVSSAF